MFEIVCVERIVLFCCHCFLPVLLVLQVFNLQIRAVNEEAGGEIYPGGCVILNMIQNHP